MTTSLKKKKRGRPFKHPVKVKKIVIDPVINTVSPDLDATKDDQYHADLLIAGKHFYASGGSVLEVIQNLQPDNYKILKGILTISYKARKIERILSMRQLVRIFGTPSRMVKEIALKQLVMIFDGIENQ